MVKAWDGSPITFPDAPDLVLSPEQSPYLAQCKGHDIITASGTTLLGADDKAGVAIVMGVYMGVWQLPRDHQRLAIYRKRRAQALYREWEESR